MLGNALGLGPWGSKIWVNSIRFVLYLHLYSRMGLLETDLPIKEKDIVRR